jgi:hypothetical protein
MTIIGVLAVCAIVFCYFLGFVSGYYFREQQKENKKLSKGYNKPLHPF